MLGIYFTENLRYDTDYTITIGGAVAITGGILEDAPFVLSFRTEIGDEIQPPPQPTINITSPAVNTTVKPGESINVSGSSSGFSEGTEIMVTLGNTTKTGMIGADGSWLVTMTAPTSEGNYTITITVGNLNHSISITVKDIQEPQDGGADTSGDRDTDDLSMIYFAIVIVIIVIILVILGIAYLMRRKKQLETAEEEELEYEKGEDEDHYEDERDLDKKKYKEPKEEAWDEDELEDEVEEEAWDEDELTDEDEEWDEDELTNEDEDEEWDEEELADDDEEWDEEEWEE